MSHRKRAKFSMLQSAITHFLSFSHSEFQASR
jgi:hypothetical protein